MAMKKQVLFDKTSSKDIYYFLFCFEHVAETNSAEEERERLLIGYLGGRAFEFYFHQCLRNRKLIEEARSYEIVNTLSEKKFRLNGTHRRPLRSHCCWSFIQSSQLQSLLTLRRKHTLKQDLQWNRNLSSCLKQYWSISKFKLLSFSEYLCRLVRWKWHWRHMMSPS